MNGILISELIQQFIKHFKSILQASNHYQIWQYNMMTCYWTFESIICFHGLRSCVSTFLRCSGYTKSILRKRMHDHMTGKDCMVSGHVTAASCDW